ncbi:MULTISPECIES: copper-binding protein [Pandoraea]|uniref:copper-binding protein n=1 Tax=Pandoraea TaxID=93217 RepID=UPI001F5D7E56|nr:MULTISPECIES: copper-binding protein [Pandoraea]MCI3204387.1 RND transporter MFP subunit [Pandoraea sp. LA3]MDN4582414.1 RND transporter MFP subunit [Pandoraea capi]
MKQVLVVSGVLLASLSASAFAAGDMGNMAMPAKPTTTPASTPASTADANAALTDATVKSVDTSTGMVMLQHGTMANIGMPAMTMAYKAKDAAMAKGVHAGEKVRVRVENVSGTLTIVRMDK